MLPMLPVRASAFAIIALLVAGLFGVAGLAGSGVLAASTFPDRAVKFIVPVPPGPLLDMLPRMLGEKLLGTVGTSCHRRESAGSRHQSRR